MRAGLVLAGGRSSRMGTNKLALRLAGKTLLERTVAALLPHSSMVVVAGPAPDDWVSDDRVSFIREDPPFGGPVAGIEAGITRLRDLLGAELTEAEVLVLAGDLFDPEPLVNALVAAEMGRDGVVFCDQDGWLQYLAGRYRFSALTGELARVRDVRHMSVRRFASNLTVARLFADDQMLRDIDDLHQAKEAGLLPDDPLEERNH